MVPILWAIDSKQHVDDTYNQVKDRQRERKM